MGKRKLILSVDLTNHYRQHIAKKYKRGSTERTIMLELLDTIEGLRDESAQKSRSNDRLYELMRLIGIRFKEAAPEQFAELLKKTPRLREMDDYDFFNPPPVVDKKDDGEDIF